MDEKEIRFEYDMLKGCINRMFLTDDLEEFSCIYESAKKRLEKIYNFHHSRLTSE